MAQTKWFLSGDTSPHHLLNLHRRDQLSDPIRLGALKCFEGLPGGNYLAGAQMRLTFGHNKRRIVQRIKKVFAPAAL